MVPTYSLLLQLLIENGLVTKERGDSKAFELKGPDGSWLPENEQFSLLIQDPEIDALALLRIVADAEGVEVFDTSADSLSEESNDQGLVSLRDSIRWNIVPLRRKSDELEVLCSYPIPFDDLESLAHILELSIRVKLCTPSQIEQLRNKQYGASDVSEISSIKDVVSETMILESDDAGRSDGRIKEYVERIVYEAIKRRASDIHFEPLEQAFRVRCRIDGNLVLLDEPDFQLATSIVSRIKLMSQINIAEKRLPQDGRFHLAFESKEFDFRVSCIPTTHGEGIVIRILDKNSLAIGLEELGMMADHQKCFQRVISAPDGIFLVTGPTGSGKSTSLYAALNHINDPGVKIITVEDPVEYHIRGINQVQVRSEINMTFSAALRSILRQAPNIIMVGEIRDKETADIAINASLTGHTVFSTLHTNDAGSAITRLIDMGTKPFLVAAALRAVLAQRLVRRIAEGNQQAYKISSWELAALGTEYTNLTGKTFYKAGKNNDQYLGRMGVFEMFEIDENLAEVIYSNGSLSKIKKCLRESGFKDMRHDGIRKALEGKTTLEEVMSVTIADNWQQNTLEPTSVSG